MKSRFQRDGSRAMQSFRWRARLILQFEIRMKRREMQRNIGSKILLNPISEPPRFLNVVI